MASTGLKTGSTRSCKSDMTASNDELCDGEYEVATGEMPHGVRCDKRGGNGDVADRGSQNRRTG